MSSKVFDHATLGTRLGQVGWLMMFRFTLKLVYWQARLRGRSKRNDLS
jgi:hypothetical protein